MKLPYAVYFIRHGETDWNAEGRLQGQRDIGLNELGRKQAANAGRILLRAGIPYADCAYVASPLHRTRETMEILRATLGLPADSYRQDPLLKELTFGSWEGLTWDEVRKAAPDLARARERDKWHTVPPGGESYEMLLERVAGALPALTGDTVMVSHGGVARALMVLIGGIGRTDAPNRDIVQGKVLKFNNNRCAWLG